MGVGCHGATFALIDVDFMPVAHGPSAAVATGIKRILPDAVVITMQGDGDCSAIGAGHFLNAVHRAEKITVIMTNNAVFGTTGGQMAPYPNRSGDPHHPHRQRPLRRLSGSYS